MRTATNRRRYSDADIERLHLLQRAKQMGRGIGQIANLPADRLRDLLRADRSDPIPDVVRTFLWELNHNSDLSASAPALIVATPVGQLHEIGALMVASTMCVKRRTSPSAYLCASRKCSICRHPGSKYIAVL